MLKTFRKLIFVVCILSLNVASWAGDIFVYRNSSHSDELSLEKIRGIFDSRQLSWSSGKNIVILMRDFDRVSEEDLVAFSGMTKNQFLTRWRVKFFSGRARMPLQMPKDETAIESLKAIPESVYFSFTKIDPKLDLTGIRVERFSF